MREKKENVASTALLILGIAGVLIWLYWFQVDARKEFSDIRVEIQRLDGKIKLVEELFNNHVQVADGVSTRIEVERLKADLEGLHKRLEEPR